MASIKDAIEESLSDRLSWIKYILYAIPVFVSYLLFSKGNMGLFWFLGPATIIMLMTILVMVAYNVRSCKNYSLPTFNIFNFGIAYFKLIFAVVPVWGICAWGANSISKIQIPIPIANIQLIYTIIVWLIFGSIMLTSLTCYARRQKIADAYDIKTIFNYCVDVLIAFLFYIPQTAIVNGIVIGILCYLFGLFGNFENPLFVFLCSIIIVINVAITGNYLAQIDYETISKDLDG